MRQPISLRIDGQQVEGITDYALTMAKPAHGTPTIHIDITTDGQSWPPNLVTLEEYEGNALPLSDEQIEAIAERVTEKIAAAMVPAIEAEREAINHEALGR